MFLNLKCVVLFIIYLTYDTKFFYVNVVHDIDAALAECGQRLTEDGVVST